MKWTDEQQKVIDTRDSALLVSAAAGSGKTAVLVERIIRKIIGENPVDIDRMLIVTFTNAAAAEMRERIGKAIAKELEKNPENEHLQKQNVLIHHAPITTIHSFCLQVIHNYFHKTNRDPNFRIADEGEMSLISEEVLDQVLERWYEEKKPEFQALADRYVTAKGDGSLREMVLELHRCSMSHPWPKQWLLDCQRDYEDIRGLDEQNFMKFFLEYAKNQAASYAERYERLVKICEREPGFEKYAAAFGGDLPAIKRLTECETYGEFQAAFEKIAFVTKPRRSKKDIYDVDLDAWIAESRKAIKNEITGWKDKFFSGGLLQILQEFQENAAPIRGLVGITLDYQEALQAYKLKKNLIDFGDIEHDALSILVDQTPEGNIPSDVARQYQMRFEEIMIDEYQDSNEVQEMILTSISGYEKGRPNLFMVGDVKQSIYKFRLAKPELFMDKYERFQTDGLLEKKIELDQNFRSRAEVLGSINYIFRQIMQKILGGIAYTDKQALYPGAGFKETSEDVGGPVELMLMDIPEESYFHSVNYTRQEWEAKMIANRIHQLVDPVEGKTIWDKETGNYRKAEYKDIVILLRATAGWSDALLSILGEEGIPVEVDSRSGYFAAREVQVLLNYLRILDNPMQDIPLASVLTSELAGLRSEEMAQIRIVSGADCPDGFYGKVRFFTEHVKEGAIAEKLRKFFKEYEYFRKRSLQVPLQDLLAEIYEETGYLNMVTAMSHGGQRRANLMMLLEKAKNYENTGYRGLFRFIRYVEKLEKYELDFSEALAEEGNQNVVRIMSIHKSKGLEFPIVFVAGLKKKFNEMDLRKPLMVHPDLGIALDRIDPIARTKKATFTKKVLIEKARQENKGEELRVLYVALTRAKELLILTAGEKGLEEKLPKMMTERNSQDPVMAYHPLMNAGCYLDWVLPAVCRHPSAKKFLLSHGISGYSYETGEGAFRVSLVKEEDLSERSRKRKKKENTRLLAALAAEPDRELDRIYQEKMQEYASYQYPYELLGTIHSTMSVSELKKKSMEEAEVAVHELVTAPVEGISGPNLGAIRGDAYHHFLYGMPMREHSEEELEEERLRQKKEGILSEQEAELLDPADIAVFLESSAAKRMIAAEKEGRLYREKQFMMGLHPSEIKELELPEVPAGDEEEYINIQGIIDVFWEEDDGLVILDYKTDRVPVGTGEDILRKKYTAQLYYYRKALEMYTGKEVKERIIYSFALHKAIEVLEK